MPKILLKVLIHGLPLQYGMRQLLFSGGRTSRKKKRQRYKEATYFIWGTPSQTKFERDISIGRKEVNRCEGIDNQK